MKTFFRVLEDLIDSWAKARAASVFARQGRYEEARKVFK